jgi:hypothetical protein
VKGNFHARFLGGYGRVNRPHLPGAAPARMKIIDYIIIAAILGCLFLAYAGFRIEAGLLFVVVVTVASWRFWDRSREKHMMRGASGDNCPDDPDSIYASGHDSSHSSSDSGGDSGGGGDD